MSQNLYAWKCEDVIIYTDTQTPTTSSKLYKADGTQYVYPPDHIEVEGASYQPYINSTDGSTYIKLSGGEPI